MKSMNDIQTVLQQGLPADFTLRCAAFPTVWRADGEHHSDDVLPAPLCLRAWAFALFCLPTRYRYVATK